MVIIEKDGIRYEATEIIERTREDIEAEIVLKQWYIDRIKLTDIEVLELLLFHWIIEQDVLDLAKQSNIMKQQEIDLLQSEIVDLETKLDT